jgi:hypothetical protein
VVTNGTIVSDPRINKFYKSNYVYHMNNEPGELNWYSDGLQAGQLEVPLLAGAGILFHSTAFRLALRPTQPPIQLVLVALSLGVK